MKRKLISAVVAIAFLSGGIVTTVVAQQQGVRTYSPAQIYSSGQFSAFPANAPSAYSSHVYHSAPVKVSNPALQQYPPTYTYTSSAAIHSSSIANSTYSNAKQNSSSQYASAGVTPGLAQQKAQQAAQMGLRNHVGGGYGGAKYEGVGWSNQSPQAAIQQCCYWGQRPTAQVGVSKGGDGCWYACVLYH